MKIRPVGAKLFLVDGHIEMTKLIVAFRSFANAPKSYQLDGAQNKDMHLSRRILYTVGHAL